MIETPPFDATWFRLVIGFLIGLCFGSFITMLSYRLPKRMSIVKPDSHCPTCQKPLQPVDLIPIGSWLLSRGACRYCQTEIGARYPLIELATGLSFMATFGLMGFQWALVIVVAALTAVITAVTIKIETSKR